MSVIARRTLYAKEHYPSWKEGLARAALGVVQMGMTRDITAQGMVRLLHFAKGGAYLRSHTVERFSTKMAHSG